MSHTTDYVDTFIAVADDCPVSTGTVPPVKDVPTAASRQFEMIAKHPYRYSSDDVLFAVFADKNAIMGHERAAARGAFFSKGQPCLRASPLTKRYGWGLHFDAAGKVAAYAVGSPEYDRFASDPALKQLKAVRSKRA